MTKAERIFKDTKFECKKYIEIWGYEENTGFNTVIYDDNETVCKRTLNELTNCLVKAKKMLAIDIKLNILTPEQVMKEMQILRMVENTINNTVR